MASISFKKFKPLFVVSLIFLMCSSVFMAPLNKASAESINEHTAKLVEGAKKEGKLLWYTAMNQDQTNKLLKRFQEMYPFIEARSYRVNLVTKIIAELQAGRYLFDVVNNITGESQSLKKKGFLTKYISPESKFYPDGFKDPEGYWTSVYYNTNLIIYNTRLVSPKEAPRTFEDLLAPQWKGKIGMDTKAYDWFGHVLKIMGEKKGLEYMKKLSEQNIKFRTGRTLNSQLVVAGELSIGMPLYSQDAVMNKMAGAPIEWVGIEPVIVTINSLAISAHPPHPNAARLFTDFLLSREGQHIIASFYRSPSRNDVDAIDQRLKSLKLFPYDYSVADDYNKYAKLYQEILMKKIERR